MRSMYKYDDEEYCELIQQLIKSNVEFKQQNDLLKQKDEILVKQHIQLLNLYYTIAHVIRKLHKSNINKEDIRVIFIDFDDDEFEILYQTGITLCDVKG